VRTVFDLVILAALCKELFATVERGLLPYELFLLGILSLPFLLGMAGETYGGSIVWEPARAAARTSVGLLTLATYAGLQALQGTSWVLSGTFLAALLLYFLGRIVGLAWRFVLVMLALLAVVYVVTILVRGR
jgi:hypothetical protein